MKTQSGTEAFEEWSKKSAGRLSLLMDGLNEETLKGRIKNAFLCGRESFPDIYEGIEKALHKIEERIESTTGVGDGTDYDPEQLLTDIQNDLDSLIRMIRERGEYYVKEED